jgi:ferredoxin
LAKRLRIHVDVNSCCGYGACKEVCPQIYQLDRGGRVVLTTDVVPEGLEEKAIEGAEVCPQSVITIETFED